MRGYPTNHRRAYQFRRDDLNSRNIFTAWAFFCRRLFKKREDVMNKDRIEGSAHQAKGKVKEVAGKVTGDAKSEAEGKTEKIAGKVQNTIGGLKDAVKDAANR
jgi:uncharacterized protein YjbJ (UPF0337 family)